MRLARRAVVMLTTVGVAVVFSSPSAVPLIGALGLPSCVAMLCMRWPFYSWCRRHLAESAGGVSA